MPASGIDLPTSAMGGIDLVIPIDACGHQVLQIAARAPRGDTAEAALRAPAKTRRRPPSETDAAGIHDGSLCLSRPPAAREIGTKAIDQIDPSNGLRRWHSTPRVRICSSLNIGIAYAEVPTGRGCGFRLCVYRRGRYRADVTNLLAGVSVWSRVKRVRDQPSHGLCWSKVV